MEKTADPTLIWGLSEGVSWCGGSRAHTTHTHSLAQTLSHQKEIMVSCLLRKEEFQAKPQAEETAQV